MMPARAADSSMLISANIPTLSVGSSSEATMAAEINEKNTISITDMAKQMRNILAILLPSVDLFEPSIRKTSEQVYTSLFGGF